MDVGFLMHALSGLLRGWILVQTPSAARLHILGHTCHGSLTVYCFRENPWLAELDDVVSLKPNENGCCVSFSSKSNFLFFKCKTIDQFMTV